MNLNQFYNIEIPEGKVKEIRDSNNNILWQWNNLTNIKSTGLQVIDTGVYCTNKMSCEIKIAWTAFPSNATYIGAIEKSGSSYYRCHFQAAKSGSNQVIGFWQDSPTMGNAISIPFDTEPHILTYSAKNLTVGIDGNIATHGNTPPPSNCTFYLYDRNVVGFTANAEPGKCKTYYAKFWEDDILIRHFIPKIDPNGKAGLYDLIEGKYYYDLNGNNFEYEIL